MSRSDRSACRPDRSFSSGRPLHGQRRFQDGGCSVSWLPHVFQSNWADSREQENARRATIYNAPFVFKRLDSIMDLGLKNRAALVAASSQGLGLACAEAFAAEGCRVAMCARNAGTLQAAAEKIRKQHHAEVLAEAFDVGDPGAVGRFVAAV